MRGMIHRILLQHELVCICLPIYPPHAKHTPFLCDKHQTRFQPRKAYGGQILGSPIQPTQSQVTPVPACVALLWPLQWAMQHLHQ